MFIATRAQIPCWVRTLRGNAVCETDQQIVELIERLETDESLGPGDAEKLVLDIFVGCGLPAFHRGGPGDQGLDVEFTADDALGGDGFAVQV